MMVTIIIDFIIYNILYYKINAIIYASTFHHHLIHFIRRTIVYIDNNIVYIVKTINRTLEYYLF